MTDACKLGQESPFTPMSTFFPPFICASFLSGIILLSEYLKIIVAHLLCKLSLFYMLLPKCLCLTILKLSFILEKPHTVKLLIIWQNYVVCQRNFCQFMELHYTSSPFLLSLNANRLQSRICFTVCHTAGWQTFSICAFASSRLRAI